LWPLTTKDRVKALDAVKDIAECGIKLFEEYNQIITHDEEEKRSSYYFK